MGSLTMERENANVAELVDGMSGDELRDALALEGTVLLLEGGNMFPDVTRIMQDNVAPTLMWIYEEVLPELGIDRKAA